MNQVEKIQIADALNVLEAFPEVEKGKLKIDPSLRGIDPRNQLKVFFDGHPNNDSLNFVVVVQDPETETAAYWCGRAQEWRWKYYSPVDL